MYISNRLSGIIDFDSFLWASHRYTAATSPRELLSGRGCGGGVTATSPYKWASGRGCRVKLAADF